MSIVHCQHDDGFLLIPLKFSLFSHIPQRNTCRLFFVLKNILLFVAVAAVAEVTAILLLEL